jgi:hypothetical protein
MSQAELDEYLAENGPYALAVMQMRSSDDPGWVYGKGIYLTATLYAERMLGGDLALAHPTSQFVEDMPGMRRAKRLRDYLQAAVDPANAIPGWTCNSSYCVPPDWSLASPGQWKTGSGKRVQTVRLPGIPLVAMAQVRV